MPDLESTTPKTFEKFFAIPNTKKKWVSGGAIKKVAMSVFCWLLIVWMVLFLSILHNVHTEEKLGFSFLRISTTKRIMNEWCVLKNVVVVHFQPVLERHKKPTNSPPPSALSSICCCFHSICYFRIRHEINIAEQRKNTLFFFPLLCSVPFVFSNPYAPITPLTSIPTPSFFSWLCFCGSWKGNQK